MLGLFTQTPAFQPNRSSQDTRLHLSGIGLNLVQEFLSSRRFERSCISDALLCNWNCRTALTLRAVLKHSHSNSCTSGQHNVVIVPSQQLCHPTLPARGTTRSDFPAVLSLSSAATEHTFFWCTIFSYSQFASEGFESRMFQVKKIFNNHDTSNARSFHKPVFLLL